MMNSVMRCCCILFLSVALAVLAHGDDLQPCADASLLLPFLSHQIKQGMSLIVFQGTAIPQVWNVW